MLVFHEWWIRLRHFFKEGIWHFNAGDGSRLSAFLLWPFRVMVLALQGFVAGNCSLQASALTYYSLLAVVPVVAMLLGLAQGFGLDQQLEKPLSLLLAGQQEALEKILIFSRNLLKNARGGVMASVGVIVLFWSAINVLGRIEATFNQIWKVASRTLIRKFTDYLAILIIAPFLVIISSSINLYINAHMAAIIGGFSLARIASPLVWLLLKLLPYGLIWLLFLLVYLVIPNTRVRFLSAFVGSLVAAVFFQVVQGSYIYAQLLLSRYNAIYGSFAALPFFLIWMQLSWMIVLFGAQIAYAHQEVGHHAVALDYQRISPGLRKKYALYVFQALVGRFREAGPPLTAAELADSLDLPFGLITRSLDMLKESGLISAVMTAAPGDGAYQPARDINVITVADVLQNLDRIGGDDLPASTGPQFSCIHHAVEEIAEAMQQSPANRFIKDL